MKAKKNLQQQKMLHNVLANRCLFFLVRDSIKNSLKLALSKALYHDLKYFQNALKLTEIDVFLLPISKLYHLVSYDVTPWGGLFNG